ncbi:DNA polymerase epsilon catalytic subunit A-like protein [Tanacetum coccineum]
MSHHHSSQQLKLAKGGAATFVHQAEYEKFYNGHLLENETYISGHVECLETGVFRSDLLTCFKLDPSAFNVLIENLDRDLLYAIRVEGKMDIESVSNHDEVKNAIMEKLIMLRDEPTREECPLIYHLDVATMILTTAARPYGSTTTKAQNQDGCISPNSLLAFRLPFIMHLDVDMKVPIFYLLLLPSFVMRSLSPMSCLIVKNLIFGSAFVSMSGVTREFI